MEKDIQDLTKEELLNPDFLPSIFDNYPDENERAEEKNNKKKSNWNFNERWWFLIN